MNDHIARLQRALGIPDDGIRGPITDGAILRAADDGRLSVAVAPASSTSAQEPPWVAEMRKVMGLHEVRDKARLAAWLKSDGRTLGDPTALPWCGDAVETAIRLALPTEPLPGALGANPYFARNWAAFGIDYLAFGSIGVFERGPTSGHVGFLIGQSPTTYHVLGGNQGDSVSIVQIAKSRLIAARWPSTWPLPPRGLPQISGTAPLSHNEA